MGQVYRSAIARAGIPDVPVFQDFPGRQGDRLVGKDLSRVYEFSASGQLVIKSALPDEHWSATWKHY